MPRPIDSDVVRAIAQAPSSLTDRRAPLRVAFLLFGVLASLGFGLALYLSHEHTLEDYQPQLRYVARLVAQTTSASLERQETVLTLLAQRMQRENALAEPRLGVPVLREILALHPGNIGFAMSDPDGQIQLLVTHEEAQVHGEGGVALPNLAGRADSAAGFREAVVRPGVSVARPYYFEPTGDWITPVRKALRDPRTGGVEVVLSTGFAMEGKGNSWRPDQIPPGLRIHLVRADGYYQFAHPLPEAGAVLYDYPAPEELMRALSGLDTERVHAIRSLAIDDQDFMVAAAPLELHGIWVVVSSSYTTIRQAWASHAAGVIGLFVLAMLGIFGVYRLACWLTGRIESEREVAQHELRVHSTAVSESPNPILVANARGQITYTNTAFARELGDFTGMPVTAWPDGETQQSSLDALRAAMRNLDEWRGELAVRHEGDTVWYSAVLFPLDDAGFGRRFVMVLENVSIRKRYEAELLNQAHYDALTGLPNRAYAAERIEQALRLNRRDGSQVGLLFLDVDKFKRVNDTYGHSMGDAFLHAVSDRLRACLRQEDLLGRFGGDEFIVLLPSVKSVGDAEVVARKLLAGLSDPIELDGEEVYATASIGIALAPEDGKNAEDLLRAADSAMYRAKRSGGSRYTLVRRDLDDGASREMAIENQLRHALQSDDVQVVYQPQYDLRSGRMMGVEALARWTSSTLGVVPPSEFIPIAERQGLIGQLDDYVLQRALSGVAELSRLTGHPLTLSVNVSGLEFGDEALPQRIQARLDAAGFPAERLELELTESVLVDNVDLMIRALGELRAIGVRIAIDDFGTGYSSLSYVHAFPADTLKIDRSFVVDLMERGQTRAVVSAILVLAQGLELDVVAEGVETPAQLELLRDLGCGLAQGFGLAKPMPIEELCERVWSEQAKPGELAVGH